MKRLDVIKRLAVKRLAAMKRVAGALLLAMGVAGVAEAHALHTTMTVAKVDATGVTFNIRTFADDFSASVAQSNGRRTPADSSAPAPDALRYVRARFAVFTASGAPVDLVLCGIRRQAEMYFVCLRASLPQGSTGARLRNELLTERHADQVNIVKVESGGKTQMLMFTKGSAPARLPA